MRRGRGALFVHRRTYRRRRVGDAARLLPLLGAVLFVLPLLWQGGSGDGERTAWVMAYLFCVWAGLAGLAGVLSRHLANEEDGPEADGQPEDGQPEDGDR